jgi:hypothetical protein
MGDPLKSFRFPHIYGSVGRGVAESAVATPWQASLRLCFAFVGVEAGQLKPFPPAIEINRLAAGSIEADHAERGFQ